MRLVGLAGVSSLLVLACGAAGVPGAALAANTRYAAPDGLGTNSCGPNDPCDSLTATNNAASGDTVVFYGDRGTYGSLGSPTNVVLHVKDGVTVTGAPGQPMPVWYSAASGGPGVNMDGSGSRLLDFDVEDSASTGDPALLGPGTVDRVIARHASKSGAGCSLFPDAILTNSICAGSNGLSESFSGGSATIALTLRNDLVYGSGDALQASSDGPHFTITATNTIFHSTFGNDVSADLVSGSMTVTADHSNYASVNATGGATVTASNVNGNQSAAPEFANEGGGDFREVSGSPTIDAGVDDPLNGSLDLAGAARTSGARTDIGPYEVQVASVSPPPPGGGPPPPGVTPPPAITPAISGLAESARTWREGSALPRLARKRRPPIGTTFSFRLNEAARVTLTFTQSAAGRRVSGRCVGPSRRNARRPRCRRTVTAGALSLAAHAGTNRLRFQGRLSRTRRLRPGRYAAVVVATAPSGLRSVPRSVSFTIVR